MESGEDNKADTVPVEQPVDPGGQEEVADLNEVTITMESAGDAAGGATVTAEQPPSRFYGDGWKIFTSRLLHFTLPRFNKESLYVYGSEGAVTRERTRQEEGGVWVIHPLSPIRHYYVMFMVFITFLNLVTVPLEIGFTHDELHVHGPLLVFSVFSDILYIFDIALNFRMGIQDDEHEVAVLDLYEIKMAYLKTWFIPDVLSAVPIDLILLIAEHQISDPSPLVAGKIIRFMMFLRIISLIRAIRISKFMKFFNDLQRVSNANLEVLHMFMGMTRLFMVTFLVCHWNGCVQLFVAQLQEFPEDCWLKREKLMNASVGDKYAFAVFRAFSHMISIGYGSIDPPSNEIEILVCMISMISGSLIFALLVSNIWVTMTSINVTSKAYKSKLNQLEDYMAYRKLPKNLRHRIIDYYQTRYGGKWFDDRSILNMVSMPVRKEIGMVLCSNILKNVTLFQNQNTNFINTIVLMLKYAVFQQGDIIVEQHSVGSCMYFIDHGKVMVQTESFQRELTDGDYFGEICLLNEGKRTVTVQALTVCHLFCLSADDFHRLLQSFPNVRKEIVKTARTRLEELQQEDLLEKASEEDLSEASAPRK